MYGVTNKWNQMPKYRYYYAVFAICCKSKCASIFYILRLNMQNVKNTGKDSMIEKQKGIEENLVKVKTPM